MCVCECLCVCVCVCVCVCARVRVFRILAYYFIHLSSKVITLCIFRQPFVMDVNCLHSKRAKLTLIRGVQFVLL